MVLSNPVLRFWSKVNKTEGCWLWTGACNDRGYGVFWFQGALIYAHRFSYELSNGSLSDGEQVDHRPTCLKSCVYPFHLRVATNKQNNENHAGLKANNTSGARGVSWDKGRGKWKARVGHQGQEFFLGYFIDKEEAAETARLKRLELFTHNDLDREVFANV